jgi:acyl-CoA thioesterase-1
VKAAYLFASGLPYFVGAALIVAAAALPFSRSRLRNTMLRALAFCGAALVVGSATPVPWWLYGAWAVALVAWLVAPALRGPRRTRLLTTTRVALIAVCAIATTIEANYQRTPRLPAGKHTELHVIGDSLSAGVGSRGEVAWPALIAEKHGIAVRNHAVAGATAKTAEHQAASVDPGRAVVFILIGGNDLLGGRSAEVFERDLDDLLARLDARDRALIMVELPLPPGQNAYGAAQRRLARSHGVTLIPKRHLASVFLSEGATVDGLHLSNHGHELMADRAWSIIHDLFGK